LPARIRRFACATRVKHPGLMQTDYPAQIVHLYPLTIQISWH
jgi:hypothetical protein